MDEENEFLPELPPVARLNALLKPIESETAFIGNLHYLTQTNGLPQRMKRRAVRVRQIQSWRNIVGHLIDALAHARAEEARLCEDQEPE